MKGPTCPTQAETRFKYVYDKASDKLMAGRALAAFMARHGRVVEGRKILDEARAAYSDKVAGWIAYGDYNAILEPQQAEESYRNAIQVKPDDPRGPRALAAFYYIQRRYKEAADYWDKYVSLLKEKDRVSLRQQCDFWLEAGKIDEAEKQLTQLISNDPSDMEAQTLMGLLYLRKDDTAKAEEVLTKALNLNRTHPHALIARAQVYLTSGDIPKARDGPGAGDQRFVRSARQHAGWRPSTSWCRTTIRRKMSC